MTKRRGQQIAASTTLAARTTQSGTGGRRDLLYAVLLFAGTVLIYAQVWGFGFITVDDSAYVPGNIYVQQGITLRSIIWSFTTFHDSNWIPLTWLSLMLDTDIYGVRPGGYHLTNILLHAANAVILFWALARATGNATRSAFVAALFALHPLHVESVAWVAERKDVLSTLFGLLSLWTYVRYATGAGRGNLLSSWLFLVLSLLAKQTLVTLPCVFLLLDYWPLGRLRAATAVPDISAKLTRPRGGPSASKQDAPPLSGGPASPWRLVVEKLPFFAVSALFSAVVLAAQSRGGAVMTFGGFTFASRCLNAVYVYAAYLNKALFPQNLAVYYPHPHENLTWAVLLPAAALLVAISVAAVAFLRRFPYLFVGWCWYLGTLVPMIGLVQIGTQQMADRYTYFPLIGIFLAATWLVPELVPAGMLRARVLPAAAVTSLLFLAATTFSQISYWHDSVTLLRHSMDSTPDNSVAHEFLGSAYVAEGSLNEGVEELEKAIQLAPNYAPLHADLGAALQQLGRFDKAAAQYRTALELDERSAETHTNLGLVFFKQRKFADAAAHYRRALEIDPNFVPAHVDLAALYLENKDYAAATAESERALRLAPGLIALQLCMAMALRGEGKVDEAIQRMQQLVKNAPNDPSLRDELARTLALKSTRGGH